MTLALLAAELTAAVICGWRWWRPAMPPLRSGDGGDWAADDVVPRDRLRRVELELGTRAATALSQFGVGKPSAKRLGDLALAEMSPNEHFGAQLALAVLGPAIVVAPRLGLLAAGAGGFSARGLFASCAAAATAGHMLPDLRLRRLARRRRDDLTAAIGFVARLGRIAVAGGAGIDTAIPRASMFGDGWGHDTLRSALAEQHGRSALHALLAVGVRYGVPQAEQLADALAVAKEQGAPILGVLAASARGIQDDRLHAAETAQARKGVLLSLPVGLMLLGVMVVLVGGFVAQTLQLFVT
ncbi:MAG: tight adherence protein [Acidimicrobiaceae bacterium]|nr:tight adherence protein [Acidimicrobiaceae bacterium]